MMELLKQLRQELQINHYSPKTVKSYLSCVKTFLNWAQEDPKRISEQRVKEFLLQQFDKGKSSQTVGVYLNALKFFFKRIIKRGGVVNVRFPKKTNRLPIVLSRREIKLLLDAVKNKKHHLMIALAYGAGLRVSEVVSLRVSDIDAEQGLIHLKQAKGKKDRLTIFPQKLLKEIQIFLAGKQGSDLVFPSDRGGKLTTHSLQKVFKKGLSTAGISKPASFHSLRHTCLPAGRALQLIF